MTIEIVSYISELSGKIRLSETVDVINTSTSELLLFSGSTINKVSDIEKLRCLIANNRTEVILELQDIKSEMLGNCLYRVSKGKLTSLNTNQLFSESKEVDGNPELAQRLLHEFENRRKFNIGGLTVLIIQCGELNILKNFQNASKKVDFRLNEDQALNARFQKILSNTDIVLNPIHTPMSRQGIMAQRRVFLSNKNRSYFSTSNTPNGSENLNLKSLQYAYKNGDPIKAFVLNEREYSISRIYTI